MGTLAPIQLRRNLAAYWTGTNPVLAAGEPVYAIDTHILKIGDGGTNYNDLPAMANVADVTELNEHVEDLIAEMVAAGASIQEALQAANELQTWLVNVQAQIAADNDATVAEIEASNAITYNEIQADNDETVAEVGVIRDQTVVARQGAETAKTAAEDAANLALAGQFTGTTVSSATANDVNNMLTPGVYRFSSAAGANTSNLPLTYTAGILRVWNVVPGGAVMQEFLPYGNNAPAQGIFMRRAPGNQASWRFIPGMTFNNPADQPGITIGVTDPTTAVDRNILPVGIALGNVDLNSVTLNGQYYQNSSANATIANNYPLAGTAALDVYNAAASGRVIQELRYHSDTPTGRPGIYQRSSRSNNIWTAWRAIAPQVITNPSDQPGVGVETWDDVNSKLQGIMPANTNLGTVNLDLVTFTGVYAQPTAQTATLARNYPIAGIGGTLEVFNSGDLLWVQRFTSVSGTDARKGFWQRRKRSTDPWQAWQFIASQRVDETAGRAIYTWDDLNNREQRVFGDTGFRSIGTLMQNGWTLGSAGGLFIRRSDDLVTLMGYNIDGSAATSTTIINNSDIPGFQPAIGSQRLPIIRDGGTTLAALIVSSNATLGGILLPTGGIIGSIQYWAAQWTTTQAWPTSLPGNAQGSIPYL